jgi:hypothetical protein
MNALQDEMSEVLTCLDEIGRTKESRLAIAIKQFDEIDTTKGSSMLQDTAGSETELPK